MTDREREDERAERPRRPRGPGTMLRAARLEKGLAAADVGSSLNLSTGLIEAIEADQYDGLPPMAFTRGYVRAYARLLELDVEQVLQRLNDHLGQTPASQPTQVSASVDPTPGAPRFLAWSGAVLLIGGALIAGGWWLAGQSGWFVAERDEPLERLEEETAAAEEAGDERELEELAEDLAAGEGTPTVEPSDDDAPREPASDSVVDGIEEEAEGLLPDVDGEVPGVDDPEVDREPEGMARPEDFEEEDETAVPDLAETGEEEALAEDAMETEPEEEASPDETPAPDDDLAAADQPGEAVTEDDAVPEEEPEAPRSEYEGMDADEAPEPDDGETLLVSFAGPSWVEIEDARGVRLLYGLIQDEGEHELYGEPPFSLVIGDVTQVRVEHDGAEVGLGAMEPGRVARIEVP